QSFLHVPSIQSKRPKIEVWLCERRIESYGLLEQMGGARCQLFVGSGIEKCRTVSFIARGVLGKALDQLLETSYPFRVLPVGPSCQRQRTQRLGRVRLEPHGHGVRLDGVAVLL